MSLQSDPAKSIFADYVEQTIRSDARVVPKLVWRDRLLEVRVPQESAAAARACLPLINKRGAPSDVSATVVAITEA
ncbi:MAG TPA: hypothetical protein VF557_12835 [Jatrophihabitans sp.]|jgi:hypothetical protein|uniref:hypothetical protein n=1 Tax=Jatrophihabitans sp. TaxID=1932789 RepID=UPI002F2128C6